MFKNGDSVVIHSTNSDLDGRVVTIMGLGYDVEKSGTIYIVADPSRFIRGWSAICLSESCLKPRTKGWVIRLRPDGFWGSTDMSIYYTQSGIGITYDIKKATIFIDKADAKTAMDTCVEYNERELVFVDGKV